MIGLDTNVVIRYVVRDDPGQTAMADRLIEDQCTVERPGHIDRVVLCETVWVLRSFYGYDRAAIVAVIESILRTPQLHVDQRDLVDDALAQYRQNRADFADCLIGLLNQEAGCTSTFTLDRNAAALPGFTAL